MAVVDDTGNAPARWWRWSWRERSATVCTGCRRSHRATTTTWRCRWRWRTRSPVFPTAAVTIFRSYALLGNIDIFAIRIYTGAPREYGDDEERCKNDLA